MNNHNIFLILAVSAGLFIGGCSEQIHKDEIGRPITGELQSSQDLQEMDRGQRLPELNDRSGVSDYLRYAALNNPGLEAAFNRWKAAVEQLPQASSLPDPRFTYRYFIHEIETRVGAQRQAFELSQTFPWFGKLELAADIAGQAADAEQQRYKAATLRLFFEVKDAFYEYVYLAKAVDITRENVELMTHLESVARTRYKTTAGSHPDVMRAQIELGKLDDRLRSIQALRKPIMARLNAALNRPLAAELPWPSEVEKSQVQINDEELLNWLGESNPDLGALEFAIQQNRQSIQLAQKDYFPDITVGVNYVDVADSTGGRNPSDDGKNAVAGMISVTIPLWHEKYAAAVRQSEARYHSFVFEKQDKANTLGLELQLALYRFHDAQRKIDLYSNALLPKAKESLKVTESAFRAGIGSFLDLIDAQRIYLEFELAFERALADHEQSLAKLEMLVGKSLAPGADKKGS